MTLSSALYFSFLYQFLSCSPCFFSSPSFFLSFLVHFVPLSMLFFPARFYFQLYSVLRTLTGNPFSFPLFTHSISPNGTGVQRNGRSQWWRWWWWVLGTYLVQVRSCKCPFHFVSLEQRIMESREVTVMDLDV